MRCLKNELQNEREFADFLALVREEAVTSYLEIGSRFGGSLWQMASILPGRSRIVSVERYPTSDLRQCVAKLRKRFDVHLIEGDSADTSVVNKVAALAPFDLLFIDGCHCAHHVRSDWNNYRSFASIVAFHDIGRPEATSAKKKPWRMDVPLFWEGLKEQFRHKEIKTTIGIGVLWQC